MTDQEILALIQDALFEVAPNRKEEFEDVALDQTIEDLALDSIATMEMVGVLEDRVETTFPEDELARVRTLRDLAGVIRAETR